MRANAATIRRPSSLASLPNQRPDRRDPATRTAALLTVSRKGRSALDTGPLSFTCFGLARIERQGTLHRARPDPGAEKPPPMPDLPLRPFVVTGTARSGTAYTAMLLSGLGLRIGHEDVFGPRTRSFDGWHGQDGDSSWLAAPFLDQLPDALVLHQVRHPLKVVRSLVGVRFFADRSRLFLESDDAYTRVKWKVRESLMRAGHVPDSDHGPRPHKVYRAFLDTYEPGLWRFHTEAERALAYWVRWTHRIREHSGDERYRCYQLERLDPEHVSPLLGEMGL